MRRIRMILAVVASMAVLMSVAAAPATAAVRITNDNEDRDFFFGNDNNGVFNDVANESETGNVDLSFSVSSSGNNSNQCVTPLQFGNTGSNQNAQGFTSFDSPVDTNGSFDDFGFFFPDVFGTDVELTGGEFTFAPVLSGGCDQAVQQSSAASSF